MREREDRTDYSNAYEVGAVYLGSMEVSEFNSLDDIEAYFSDEKMIEMFGDDWTREGADKACAIISREWGRLNKN